MGCGCGGKSYARPTGTAQSVSRHAPAAQQRPQINHAPQAGNPRVIQAAALAQRRSAVVRRQV